MFTISSTIFKRASEFQINRNQLKPTRMPATACDSDKYDDTVFPSTIVLAAAKRRARSIFFYLDMTAGEHLPLLRLKVLRNSLVLGPENFQLPSVAQSRQSWRRTTTTPRPREKKRTTARAYRYDEKREQKSSSEAAKNGMQKKNTPPRGR